MTVDQLMSILIKMKESNKLIGSEDIIVSENDRMRITEDIEVYKLYNTNTVEIIINVGKYI